MYIYIFIYNMFDTLHMYNLADMVKFLHWNKEDDLILSGV